MKKRNLNYNKDFKHLIGDYGMANQPTNNAMKARAVETIYLRPLESSQGGLQYMNLITGKKITSTRFEPLLIIDIVVRQVEKLATQQGILSFEINTNNKKTLYDSAKIAGVGSEEATNETKSIIKEYEILNEEFEEVEEKYESSDEENENVSEYSAASSKEDNYEQNIIENDESNNDNDNDDNDNDKDYTSQDNMNEGTTKDNDVQEEEYKEVEFIDLRRRSTRATRQVERLNPQWRGKVYHQIKREHTKSNKHDNNINKEVEIAKHCIQRTRIRS